MRITVLGSASGLAVPHRNASAYHLGVEGHSYLLDAGEGLAQQLVRYTIDPNRIKCVFISHTHPDHVSGLFGLLQLMHLTGRQDPFQMYLPGGVVPGFESVLPYFQIFKENWPFALEILPINAGIVYQDRALQLQAIRNGHLNAGTSNHRNTGPDRDSYSFQFNEIGGRDIIFTSDVDNLNHLQIKAGDTQLIIAECTHIQIQDIIDFAHAHKIDIVVITHIPPEVDEKITKGTIQTKPWPIEFASDGMVIEV